MFGHVLLKRAITTSQPGSDLTGTRRAKLEPSPIERTQKPSVPAEKGTSSKKGNEEPKKGETSSSLRSQKGP